MLNLNIMLHKSKIILKLSWTKNKICTIKHSLVKNKLSRPFLTTQISKFNLVILSQFSSNIKLCTKDHTLIQKSMIIKITKFKSIDSTQEICLKYSKMHINIWTNTVHPKNISTLFQSFSVITSKLNPLYPLENIGIIFLWMKHFEMFRISTR